MCRAPSREGALRPPSVAGGDDGSPPPRHDGGVTTGAGADEQDGPAGWRRVVLAAGAGIGAASVVVVTLGLPTSRTFGVEDNGDGYRLYCGLGLIPRTIDRLAAWKAGVVTDFAV